MFTNDLRHGTLNQVRINLPIDTGNLQFNGTTEWGSDTYFEIKIGGVRASYIHYLEENSNSVHYKNIEDNIVPQIVRYLDIKLNGGDWTVFNESSVAKTLAKELSTRNLARREKALLRSLNKNGVTPYEYLYTTNG